MVKNASKEPVLPYSVMRLLNGLRKPLRSAVLRHLDAIVRAECVDVIRLDHVTKAIGDAANEYREDYDKDANQVHHDWRRRHIETQRG